MANATMSLSYSSILILLSFSGPDLDGRSIQKLRILKEDLDLDMFTPRTCMDHLKNNIHDLDIVDSLYHLEFYNRDKGIYEVLELEHRIQSHHLTSNKLMVLLVNDQIVENAEILSIEGRAFSLMNDELPFLGDNLAIKVNTQEGRDSKAEDGATGCNTWDASVVLAKYLELNPELVANKVVLELGSGTGLTGLAAAALGASHTVLTDLAYVIPNLNKNIDDNRAILGGHITNIESKVLDWFRDETYLLSMLDSKREFGQKWDVILAADVVWLEHLVSPLLQTIRAHSNKHTELIISHQTRSTECDTLLFAGLNDIFANCEQVAVSAHHPVYRSHKIQIYRCSKIK